MVRTKADGCTKASGGKASSKQVGRSATSTTNNASPNPSAAYAGGGNVMKIWPTPEWQKGVACFFPKVNNNPANENSTCTSTASSSISSAEQIESSSKDVEIKSVSGD